MPTIKLSRGINAVCFACAFMVPLALSFVSVIVVPPAAISDSAAGDSAGVTRVYDTDNSPSQWSFLDFSPNENKAECVSGGVVLGVSVERSLVRAPHAVLCGSSVGRSVEFDQTFNGGGGYGQTGTTEFFSTSNSADYGAHSVDWDQNHLKGECPAGWIVVGVAQKKSSDHQVDTLRCARTTPLMCIHYHTAFESNRRCHPVRLPYGPTFNQSRDWDFNHDKATCAMGEAVVGVSVDPLNHHPHAILCCQLDQFSC